MFLYVARCEFLHNCHLSLTVGAVIFYHIGCYFEYKLGIEDTARVVPVHGVWSVNISYNYQALYTVVDYGAY